jgi:bifunctional DNase/RNase
MIEVEVDSIRVSLMNQQRVVLLKDMDEDRYIPIWIGQFEAEAITAELQEGQPSRPLTHDLLKACIDAMGGTVDYVLISDLRREVFYAKVVITNGEGEQIEVDSRSSDAIALAVRARCAIFVNESVIEKAGVTPEVDVDLDAEEEETSALTSSALASALAKSDASDEDDISEDEASADVDESQLSAFADFLDTLNLDELDDDGDTK